MKTARGPTLSAPDLSYPFAPAERAAWEALAADRAGRTRRSREGLLELPLYTAAPAHPAGAPAIPASPNWRALQELRTSDPARAVERAREAANEGADGLWVRADVPLADHWTTLREAAPQAAWHLRPGATISEVGARVREDANLGELRGSLGLDPFGTLAASGRLPGGLEAAWREGAALADALAAANGFRVLDVASAPYHDAGADAAQELACVLAALVGAFRGLEPSLDRLRPALTLSVGPDLLGGVAKLRAARLLYAQLAEPCGLDPQDLQLTCVGARRALTRRDPWTNMLRGTLQAWIGAVGGADAICVPAFDRGYPDSDDLARRVARTTQLVLREESHLARVRDPLAGAYAFEAHTAELAEAAWGAFQELEREGGLAAALQTGSVQARIADQAALREQRVRTRKLGIVGVSAFPLAGEQPLERPSLPPSAPSGDGQVEPLPLRSLAAPFEDLWERAGTNPPRVFLASFGPLAGHTARSTWVQNLVAAGGFLAEVPDGYASAEEAATACRALGAKLAVVCAPDALWEGLLQAGLPRALRDAGCTRVLWAGVRPDGEAAFRAAGVDGFVGVGRDAIADLELLWEGLR